MGKRVGLSGRGPRATSIRTGSIQQGMNDFAGFIQPLRGDPRDFVGFCPAVGKIFEKHGYVIIGIRSCVAARPRTKQHHMLNPVTVQRIKRGAEFGED